MNPFPGRRRSIVAAQTVEIRPEIHREDAHEEVEAPKEVLSGRPMCHKCNKVPNHYFHVKWCKG